MRDRSEGREFDPLRVDHQESDLGRIGVHHQTGDDGINADALAAAGGAGNQQVRHFRQVGDDGVAFNALAHCKRELGPRGQLCELAAFDHASQRDHGRAAIGHLDADHGSSRNGCPRCESTGRPAPALGHWPAPVMRLTFTRVRDTSSRRITGLPALSSFIFPPASRSRTSLYLISHPGSMPNWVTAGPWLT